ncbi:MAG: 50S ribosomal protein L25 [Isosphaeraceae bacterium]
MAESVTIEAVPRDPAKNAGTGSRVSRRLRAQGRVPAIVYGHKQTPQPISVSREAVALLLKKASHLATLRIEGGSETVLVKDLQWDHLGKEILHVDFSRVSADERIETTVKLVATGQAPGQAAGGILEVLMHDLRVTCRAGAIPDEVRVDIGNLGVDEGIHVRDLSLPEGVESRDDKDKLVLHVTSRATQAIATTGEVAGPNEPEVIGKKEKEEKEKDKEK